jgi:hypothetical protein
MHVRRLGSGEAANVHAVVATLEQARRREVLARHFLDDGDQILMGELDRLVGGRLVADGERAHLTRGLSGGVAPGKDERGGEQPQSGAHVGVS